MTNVTSDVQHTFAHAFDLLEVTTSAFVVLAAKQAMASMQIPVHPTHQWLRAIAKKVVDQCFEFPQFRDAAPTEHPVEPDYPYCLCQEELGGMMIECENTLCLNGKWFHLRCVGLTQQDIPVGAWFCCMDCEKGHLGKQAASSAKRKVKSVNAVPRQTPGLDSKYEYSRAVVFRGLLQLALRDAIRENDGERMMAHWKFLMPHFYQWGHPKYLILGIKLLLAQSGAVCERLAFQLKWSRTVNAVGGVGRNIEGDLQMEHFNRTYKGEIFIWFISSSNNESSVRSCLLVHPCFVVPMPLCPLSF